MNQSNYLKNMIAETSHTNVKMATDIIQTYKTVTIDL